jgi:FKBP-type peptidyl-prolyl cis-trans isomerase
MKDQKQFLVDNAENDDVQVTESGLQYKVIKAGEGRQPADANAEVQVHYKGTLIDGTPFDSSYDRNQPMTFFLNQVIPGWQEGLQLMKEGAHYVLYVPSELGYGQKGYPGVIPPNATLVFEVELLQVY